jgi:hypothetical protein
MIKTIRADKKTKIFKGLFRLSLFLFVFSFLSQYFLCNKNALKNGALQETLVEKENLQKEIASLEYADSRLSSLYSIEQRAADLGFVPMSDSLLTVGPVVVASLPSSQ